MGQSDALAAAGTPLETVGKSLADATRQASTTVDFLLASGSTDSRLPFAGAAPFLHLMGTVIGGYMLLKAAKAGVAQITAGDENPDCIARIANAYFYATHVLPQAEAFKIAATDGSHDLFRIEEEFL